MILSLCLHATSGSAPSVNLINTRLGSPFPLLIKMSHQTDTGFLIPHCLRISYFILFRERLHTLLQWILLSQQIVADDPSCGIYQVLHRARQPGRLKINKHKSCMRGACMSPVEHMQTQLLCWLTLSVNWWVSEESQLRLRRLTSTSHYPKSTTSLSPSV